MRIATSRLLTLVTLCSCASPGARGPTSGAGAIPTLASACVPVAGQAPYIPDTTAYAPSAVTRRPERLGGPPPTYPQGLREDGINGMVRIAFVVDTSGRVEPGSVHVICATNPLFAPSAVGAINASRFSPGLRAGRPVRVRIEQPINYLVCRQVPPWQGCYRP
jgi:protein TonB